MKIYVQNGYNKRVFMAPNHSVATKKFIQSLIITKENGDELTELSPLTIVSNCGYMNDLQEMNMEKEIDEVQVYETAKILEVMGRKDMAAWIRKLPVDDVTRKLIEAI